MSRFLQGFAITGLLGALASNPALAGFDQNLYTAGHTDIAVGYDAWTGLSFHYEMASSTIINGAPIGGSGAALDPSTVSVIVPESVLMTGDFRLPAPFADNPIYLLLQTSQGAGSRPFLGFGAEDVAGGLFVGDAFSYALTDFSSSSGGDFVLYTNGNWANPDMNTADGLSASDSVNIFAGGHEHYNLGFTTAGIYDLTFTAFGTLVGGGVVETSAVFHFVVGDQPAAVPEPTSLALLGLGAGFAGLLAVRRRKAARAAQLPRRYSL